MQDQLQSASLGGKWKRFLCFRLIDTIIQRGSNEISTLVNENLNSFPFIDDYFFCFPLERQANLSLITTPLLMYLGIFELIIFCKTKI